MKKIEKFENFDERLFIDKGEYLTLSPLGKYKLLKAATDTFKKIILDSEDANYTTTVTKEKIDQEAMDNLKAPYASQLRFFDEKWEEYKEEHPEEFDVIPMIDSFMEYSVKNRLDVGTHFSVAEAYEGYQYCSRLLKEEFGKDGDGYDLLPKTSKKVSKAEYKEKHAKFLSQLREDLLLPEFENVKHTVTQVQLKRAKKVDVENATEYPLEEFLPFFVEATK